jgi:hypothetical protein
MRLLLAAWGCKIAGKWCQKKFVYIYGGFPNNISSRNFSHGLVGKVGPFSIYIGCHTTVSLQICIFCSYQPFQPIVTPFLDSALHLTPAGSWTAGGREIDTVAIPAY